MIGKTWMTAAALAACALAGAARADTVDQSQLSVDTGIPLISQSNTAAVIVGQTGDLVPADKKLYALRDVTATVDNVVPTASDVQTTNVAAGTNGLAEIGDSKSYASPMALAEAQEAAPLAVFQVKE